jgi:hypothetical protein
MEGKRFEIIEISELSGPMAHIYSVAFDDDDLTLFDHFVEDNQEHEDDIRIMIMRLRVMGNTTGCRSQYFRDNEGAPGDGVVALRQGQMRLYCLRNGNTCIFIGSGGYKSPEIAAYQEDPYLNDRNLLTRKIAAAINKAIIDHDLIVEDDGRLNTTEYLDLHL